MQKGHVNAALKLLTNNMTGGILPLKVETLDLLRQKHLEARKAWFTPVTQTQTQATYACAIMHLKY